MIKITCRNCGIIIVACLCRKDMNRLQGSLTGMTPTDISPIFRHERDNQYPPLINTLLQSGQHGGGRWPFLGFLRILLNPGCHQQVPQRF